MAAQPYTRHRLTPRWITLARSAGIGLLVSALGCSNPILGQKPGSIPEAERYVHPGSDGKLIYQEGARGDRVPDFSTCGYQGGGVVLPDAPVRVVVGPISGDNTARIQAAVDYVSQLPTDEHGLRGAVLLTSGRHLI